MANQKTANQYVGGVLSCLYKKLEQTEKNKFVSLLCVANKFVLNCATIAVLSQAVTLNEESSRMPYKHKFIVKCRCMRFNGVDSTLSLYELSDVSDMRYQQLMFFFSSYE